jgi:hypothetical protein
MKVEALPREEWLTLLPGAYSGGSGRSFRRDLGADSGGSGHVIGAKRRAGSACPSAGRQVWQLCAWHAACVAKAETQACATSDGRGAGAGGATQPLPGGRDQIGHVAQPDAAREAGEHIGQVLDRIDVRELAAAEDRVGDLGAIAAGVGAGKQEVLAGQGKSTFILPMSASPPSFGTLGIRRSRGQ